jgi:EF hand
MFFLYSIFRDESEDVMSKMFLVAIAAIAALFGSVVTWAVTERPVQAAGAARAAEPADQGRGFGRSEGRGRDRVAFGPVTRARVESRLKERFSVTDGNGDGFVTLSEAQSAGEKARTARRDFAFGAMDADKNGAVSRPEFEAQADARRAQFKDGQFKDGQFKDGQFKDGAFSQERGGRFGQRQGRDLRKAPGFIGAWQFKRMDANKDGRVSYDEALAPALARFKNSDTDGDGTLSREERKAARRKFRSERRGR